jgi:hypothetical protein
VITSEEDDQYGRAIKDEYFPEATQYYLGGSVSRPLLCSHSVSVSPSPFGLTRSFFPDG